jgi:asparagine synthase (glutamine-hydrolysing)
MGRLVSGIAAVLMPDGQAVDSRVIATMLDSMTARGPDGTTMWQSGPLGLGFLALHTTPEAVREPQPHIDRATGRAIAFDGRLDNRDDLIEALGGTVTHHDGDAALVVAAFNRWGTDAAIRLVGDFALAIADPAARSLLCIRDVIGVRPLCYARSRTGALFVASEMRALLATGMVDEAINEARALEFLSERRYDSAETLYTNVLRLPPAHVLTADHRATRAFRYWDLDPAKNVVYRRDEEYLEHSGELFGRVVRAQTRSSTRVGVLLSGGVDSSAVAALAVSTGAACEALSIIFPGQPCDESAFIRDVAERYGIVSTVIEHRPQSPQWYEQSIEDYGDLPDYPNGAMLDPLRERAAASGVRVLLTGAGGDEWFDGSRFHYADWLRRGALMRVARYLTSDVVSRGVRMTASDFAILGVWPTLPPSLRGVIKRVVSPGTRRVVPEWIPAGAAVRTALEARIAFKVTPRDGESFSQADMRTGMALGSQVYMAEMDDRSASRAGVEQRNPLYDRRVIEFAYGLPEEQRWRGSCRKYLLRQAVDLPPAVRARRDKAEFSDVIIQALHSLKRTSVPHLCERGWIVPEVFADMHDRFCRLTDAGDPRRWQLAMPLWMLFAVDRWLEHAVKRRRHERRTEAPAFA